MQYLKAINLFHIFIVAYLLYYISVQKSAAHPVFYQLLGALGAFVIVYHAFRMRMRGFNYINLFHMLVVGPLFLYIGMNNGLVAPEFYNLAFYLAIGVVAYHGSRFLGYL